MRFLLARMVGSRLLLGGASGELSTLYGLGRLKANVSRIVPILAIARFYDRRRGRKGCCVNVHAGCLGESFVAQGRLL